ncbi:class I SAM-dependent methyltransferase [Candidatus Fermentibacteria bacterium]|nr:class I SAM-dependent methyltransferase [Candidatus Fermentibacteria bacterium]
MHPIDCAELYADGRHYDLENEGFTEDIPFYLRLAARHGGPILELGCGTGRIAIPLAQAGHDVTGLDMSEPMLRHARSKLAESSAALTLIQGDCRDFAFDRLFRLILFPFNAIAHLHDRESVDACFAAVRRHLAPEGRFVIDMFNPRLDYLDREPLQRFPVTEYADPDGRGLVVITESSMYDRATQINHIVWHYRIGQIEDAMAVPNNMRIFFPQELAALLHYNGFCVECVLGDFDESPFQSDSPKQIIVAAG